MALNQRAAHWLQQEMPTSTKRTAATSSGYGDQHDAELL